MWQEVANSPVGGQILASGGNTYVIQQGIDTAETHPIINSRASPQTVSVSVLPCCHHCWLFGVPAWISFLSDIAVQWTNMSGVELLQCIDLYTNWCLFLYLLLKFIYRIFNYKYCTKDFFCCLQYSKAEYTSYFIIGLYFMWIFSILVVVVRLFYGFCLSDTGVFVEY